MRILLTLPFAALVSCVAHPYKEPPKSTPHAVLKCEKSPGLVGFIRPSVFVNEINGRPIDETWKGAAAARRIAPGSTNVMVTAVTGSPSTATTNISFEARAGQEYSLSHANEIETLLFSVKDAGTGRALAQKRARKEYQRPSSPTIIPVFIPSD